MRCISGTGRFRSGRGGTGWWDLSGLGTPARASILTALTVGLAALSYHLVEKPVRYGSLSRFLAPRRMLVAVPLALGALFAISSSVVVPRAGAALGRVTRTIVLVGDSVPQRLAPDLARAAARYGYVVVSATRGSCPATGVAVVGVTGKPWGAGDGVRHGRAGAAGRRDRAGTARRS